MTNTQDTSIAVIGGGITGFLTNASKASIVAGGCRPVYSATKGGALQLMQAMANEWIDGQENPKEARHMLEMAQPIKRLGTSQECARAALFLVSDDASYITGTYLLVDGGFCAQ